MMPRVILHNSVSLDGRIDGFEVDMELHYGTAAQHDFQASLAGSGTILAAAPPPDRGPPSFPDPADVEGAGLLVVPDSGGRVRCWNHLRNCGFFSGVLALVSGSTPHSHMKYLERMKVDHWVLGDRKVDLEAALSRLGSERGVRRVLLDGGGTLSGVLLRQGLVSEISLIVHPFLAGAGSSVPFFRDPDGEKGLLALGPPKVKKMPDGRIWLRYGVLRS